MKKVFLFLAFIAIAVFTSAQDVIITTDSKKIDAKIVEVSPTEIKYKEIDNLDGPLFVLPVSKINSIIYSNGKVQTFSQNEVAPAPTPAPAPNVVRNPYQIQKGDDGFYYLGDSKMDEAAYLEFIKNNCPAAWNSYNKGKKLWVSGWALLGGGIVIEAIGIGIYKAGLSSIYSNPRDNSGVILAYTGIAEMAIGGVMTVGSIPCLIIGGIKKNNSHEVYNEECIRQTAYVVEFGLQASHNGLGLAMKF